MKFIFNLPEKNCFLPDGLFISIKNEHITENVNIWKLNEEKNWKSSNVSKFEELKKFSDQYFLLNRIMLWRTFYNCDE